MADSYILGLAADIRDSLGPFLSVNTGFITAGLGFILKLKTGFSIELVLFIIFKNNEEIRISVTNASDKIIKVTKIINPPNRLKYEVIKLEITVPKKPAR